MAVAAGVFLVAPALTLAAPKGVFDDWKPGGSRIELPKPKPRNLIKVADILGTWCSAKSSYIIERNRLTVVTRRGARASYTISSFRFGENAVRMTWQLRGRAEVTVFERFSKDKRRMFQKDTNRAYARCARPVVVMRKVSPSRSRRRRSVSAT